MTIRVEFRCVAVSRGVCPVERPIQAFARIGESRSGNLLAGTNITNVEHAKQLVTEWFSKRIRDAEIVWVDRTGAWSDKRERKAFSAGSGEDWYGPQTTLTVQQNRFRK